MYVFTIQTEPMDQWACQFTGNTPCDCKNDKDGDHFPFIGHLPLVFQLSKAPQEKLYGRKIPYQCNPDGKEPFIYGVV